MSEKVPFEKKNTLNCLYQSSPGAVVSRRWGENRRDHPLTHFTLLPSCVTSTIIWPHICSCHRLHVWKQMALIFGSSGQMFTTYLLEGLQITDCWGIRQRSWGADGCVCRARALTQTHGCFRASWAVILLAGLIVSIWLIRFLASGVTVSHSGDGNWSAQTFPHS